MINELSLQPFNKLNCMGMLNTLLPPQSPSGNNKLPSPLLNAVSLKQERDSFFEYIRLVQKNGPSILNDAMSLGKQSGDASGWDSIQRSVDKYLRVAKNTIDDCISTTADDFTPVEEARKGKKTDSGVSFGSGMEFILPSLNDFSARCELRLRRLLDGGSGSNGSGCPSGS